MEDRVDTLLPSVLGNGQGQELSASQSIPGLAMQRVSGGEELPIVGDIQIPAVPPSPPLLPALGRNA